MGFLIVEVIESHSVVRSFWAFWGVCFCSEGFLHQLTIGLFSAKFQFTKPRTYCVRHGRPQSTPHSPTHFCPTAPRLCLEDPAKGGPLLGTLTHLLRQPGRRLPLLRLPLEAGGLRNLQRRWPPSGRGRWQAPMVIHNRRPSHAQLTPN